MRAGELLRKEGEVLLLLMADNNGEASGLALGEARAAWSRD